MKQISNVTNKNIGRNEPDAKCYWCYAVSFDNTFPTLPHALACHLSSFTNHAKVGNVEEENRCRSSLTPKLALRSSVEEHKRIAEKQTKNFGK